MTATNYITDGVESFYTSLGSKIDSVRYITKKITDKQLLNMYASSWLTGKYIDKTTEDMLKLPRVFSGDYDENLLKLVIEKENRLKLNEIKEKFLAFSSLLGDALIVAITDAGDMSLPLSDLEDIQRFIVLTKGEFTPDNNIDDDLKSANFDKPIYYTIGKNDKVHHSRCHRLKLGKSKLTDRNQFGTSELQDDSMIISILNTITNQHLRRGFPECFNRIRKLGYKWNHKRVYQVYCELKLNIWIKWKKRIPPRSPEKLSVADKQGKCWSMDFMSDSS